MKKRPVFWKTEKSYKVKAPRSFRTFSYEDLRNKLQVLADSYIPDPDRGIPPLGTLEFRYEMDERDIVTMVHAYYTDKNGNRQRFIKVSREC